MKKLKLPLLLIAFNIILLLFFLTRKVDSSFFSYIIENQKQEQVNSNLPIYIYNNSEVNEFSIVPYERNNNYFFSLNTMKLALEKRNIYNTITIEQIYFELKTTNNAVLKLSDEEYISYFLTLPEIKKMKNYDTLFKEIDKYAYDNFDNHTINSSFYNYFLNDQSYSSFNLYDAKMKHLDYIILDKESSYVSNLPSFKINGEIEDIYASDFGSFLKIKTKSEGSVFALIPFTDKTIVKKDEIVIFGKLLDIPVQNHVIIGTIGWYK